MVATGQKVTKKLTTMEVTVVPLLKGATVTVAGGAGGAVVVVFMVGEVVVLMRDRRDEVEEVLGEVVGRVELLLLKLSWAEARPAKAARTNVATFIVMVLVMCCVCERMESAKD